MITKPFVIKEHEKAEDKKEYEMHACIRIIVDSNRTEALDANIQSKNKCAG